MDRVTKTSLLRDLAIGFVLMTLYVGFGRLGLLLATLNSSVSPVWPATGLAFAALHLLGRKFWPAILVGAFVTNLFTGGHLASTIAIAMGNALEAVVGSVIIARIMSRRQLLEHQTGVLAYGVASLVAPMIAATVGVTSLAATGTFPWTVASSVWVTWWVGDVLGGLVFAPLFVAAHEFWAASQASERRAVWVKSVAFTAMTAMSTFVLFHPDGSSSLFLLFPTLLIARYAFGRFGTTVVTVVICSIAIWMTVSGTGPFMGGTLNENLIYLQLYLGALALTSLVLNGFDAIDFKPLPVSVLAVGWVISATLYHSFLTHEEERDRKHLSDLVAEIQHSIEERMATYEEALLGGVALNRASEEVTVREWRDYLATVNTIERFPGILGVGIIWIVPSEAADDFVKLKRAQGLMDFELKTVAGAKLDPSADRFVITYIEPADTNQGAMGLDISTEPNRRAAAELARDTGRATVTAKIALVQDRAKRPAFLMYSPIYRSGVPLDTVEARRRAIRGWIYAPFVTEGFFTGIVGTKAS